MTEHFRVTLYTRKPLRRDYKRQYPTLAYTGIYASREEAEAAAESMRHAGARIESTTDEVTGTLELQP